ncbi:RidA family protein [bacterium]|nr:RidA family protein [bacterium]
MRRIEHLQPKGDFTLRMGAYAHGIKIPLQDADLIFLTGQKSMDSQGNVMHPGDPEKQTEYVFECIKKILAEAGAAIDDIVKSQIYVVNMEHFPLISKVRNRYYEKCQPVSTMVEVKGLSKEGCLLEIAVTAVKFK